MRCSFPWSPPFLRADSFHSSPLIAKLSRAPEVFDPADAFMKAHARKILRAQKNQNKEKKRNCQRYSPKPFLPEGMLKQSFQARLS